MKTFVITLAQTFQASHFRKGEPTGFKDKFLNHKKIHTIRANYNLWSQRFREIDNENACLSIRQWNGSPYRSRQTELALLTKEDGIGLQCLSFSVGHPQSSIITTTHPCIIDQSPNGNTMIKNIDSVLLANNDGLFYLDWKEWFEPYDLSQPLAIIHFTPFRY